MTLPQRWPQPPQPDPVPEAKAGFFRAGKVALWLGIGIVAAVIVVFLLCFGLCGLGALGVAVTPTSSP